ncbi:ATP-dependent helicase [uncultured Helicobacter sp.]|uniref:ATP-dependent helicase n=1 Tax=uncultured Helicobacter sp. TaxID=175537 RepID=UPI003750B2E9
MSKLSRSLDSLNPQQRQAVEHTEGALLILAGAGSGKTKTLTTRLAYLIEEIGVPAQHTLTLTFTNKAATEMRERAMALLESSTQAPPLLCTFHKFGLLFLRFHIHRLGRSANFTLLDSDDCKRIAKKLAPNLTPQRILGYISSCKNASLSPESAAAYAHTPEYKALQRVYVEYEEFLRSKNMLDFDDLLYLTCEILRTHEDLRDETSGHYQYIMVDEYQDTNEIQYKLLSYLTSTHTNLCVVGDDDQSIYGWRGADINNILNFEQQFSNATLIKLEQNYRSTPEILQAANALIAHNTRRLGKNLQSTKESGQAVEILHSQDEAQEGSAIATIIAKELTQGKKAREFAVLFRLNALSRGIEEAFNKAKIPYQIIGAMRFYERAEVKDLLSYVRLVHNLSDDYSLLRIINTPRRGIGKKSQENLESLARAKQMSIAETFSAYKEECAKALGQKNFKTLEGFFAKIAELKELADSEKLAFIESLQEWLDFSKEFNALESVDRIANIEEFYGVLRDFVVQNPDESLQDFLNTIALSSSSDEQGGECVSCMSIHSAKGLEFDNVFVIGLEEEMFPLYGGGDELQEERRLGYVAFTRARHKLYLCSVESRFVHGKRRFLRPSRFLTESGSQSTSSLARHDGEQDESIKVNDMVLHKVFGTGRVCEVRDSGGSVALKINFGGNERVILQSFVQKL